MRERERDGEREREGERPTKRKLTLLDAIRQNLDLEYLDCKMNDPAMRLESNIIAELCDI